MMAMRRTALLLIILCLLPAGCASPLRRVDAAGGQTYTNSLDIRINGFRRSYLVHIPSGYRPGAPLPLVVVIHGAFDTAEGIEKISGFSRLADREGFIALYPNGMGIFGLLQHWNAGHCCGKAADDNVDDVGFVAATIEDVRRLVAVDPQRIYMAGFSNGGMLAYRFAAERGEMLAAVAPLAASIGGKPVEGVPEWRIPEPVQPLPVISMHGLLDDDVPYEGGLSLHRGGTRTYWSVEQSVGFWVRRNGCSPDAESRSAHGARVQVKRWAGCTNSAEVALYLIEDWGHVWPGRYFYSSLGQDDPLRDFDAAEVIWEFFKTHPASGAFPR